MSGVGPAEQYPAYIRIPLDIATRRAYIRTCDVVTSDRSNPSAGSFYNAT